MKMTRLLATVFASMLLVVVLAACGSDALETNIENSTTQNVNNISEAISEPEPEVTETATVEEKTQPDKGKETLVVVFSATGTTKGVAEKLAFITNADLYEIIPAEPYSDADLDWNDKNSRTTIEQNDDSVRPAIGSEIISLDGYKTIYIGYPIWWGEEPRIMDTFVESYNFDGITMIPFCTSGGSGIGRSGKNLEEIAGSGNWLDGDRLQGSISEEDLRAWIDEFK